jgi:hypothetical protein
MDNTEALLHFDASLRQRAHTFQQKLAADKSAILAKHSAAGRLRSGATLKAIAEAFEINLLEFCKDTFTHTVVAQRRRLGRKDTPFFDLQISLGSHGHRSRA